MPSEPVVNHRSNKRLFSKFGCANCYIIEAKLFVHVLTPWVHTIKVKMRYERIHSVRKALSQFNADPYTIFDRENDEKNILLWQPSGKVQNLHRFPSPEGLKNKSESFLHAANEEKCGLAAAPEWTFNLEWVEKDKEFLVGTESPLFVLGCAPVPVDHIESILSNLDEKYEVITTDEYDSDTDGRVPTTEGKLFITPTVVPIKSACRPESDEDALLVQFKTKYMSARSNSAEQKHLATGNGVWQLDPSGSETKVLVLTCSDILDNNLRRTAIDFAQTENPIIAHVQCNPKPFHKKWNKFRKDSFETETPVTYLNANWGILNKSNTDEKTIPCGYTGVFTKVSQYTTIGEGYNRTCRAGGIAGVDIDQHFEYVCSIVPDGMSKIRYHRMNPSKSPEETPAMSDVQILSAWYTNDGEYTSCSEIPDSELPDQPEACLNWQDQVNLNPAAGEVLVALLLGDIDINANVPDYDPLEYLTWDVIGSFMGSDTEGFAPLLRDHKLRDESPSASTSGTPTPGKMAYDLASMVEFANERGDILLDNNFGIKKAPVNATYDNKEVEIQLSILDTEFEDKEKARAKWLYDWYQITDKNYKPVVIVQQAPDSATFKTLEGYEDVTGTLGNPLEFDETTGLGELKQ